MVALRKFETVTHVEAHVAAPVRPVASTALWVLDLGRLEDFRSSLRADNVYSFISIYLHNLASHMEQIRESYEAGDLTAVVERAHAMMQTSENVGAIQNWDLAGKVAEAAKFGYPDLSEAIDALRFSVDTTSEALDNWRNVHLPNARLLTA